MFGNYTVATSCSNIGTQKCGFKCFSLWNVDSVCNSEAKCNIHKSHHLGAVPSAPFKEGLKHLGLDLHYYLQLKESFYIYIND